MVGRDGELGRLLSLLDDAPKAYERMMSGAARFRIVLDIASVNA